MGAHQNIRTGWDFHGAIAISTWLPATRVSSISAVHVARTGLGIQTTLDTKAAAPIRTGWRLVDPSAIRTDEKLRTRRVTLRLFADCPSQHGAHASNVPFSIEAARYRSSTCVGGQLYHHLTGKHLGAGVPRWATCIRTCFAFSQRGVQFAGATGRRLHEYRNCTKNYLG